MSARRNYEWSEGAAGPVIKGMDSGEDDSWWSYAACRTTDPEIFFPENGASARPAKAVCAGCFVRDSCRDYAIPRPSLLGVWGGTTDRERRHLREADAA